MRTTFLGLALTMFGFGFASCSLSSDHLSCDFPPNDGVDTCGDWSKVAVQYRTTIETLCRGTGADFTTGTCSSENRLGGCKATSSDGIGITWYYASDKVKTLSDVAMRCQTTDVLLDATGKETDRGNGVCSMMRTEIAVLTFKNLTTNTVSLFLRDAACVESYTDTLPGGDIKGKATHPEEVWVVRAGDNDPSGTILLEVVCEGSAAVDIK